jgi:TonB-dependent SusC/RagA subfamily outer membrane receptor
MKTISLTLGLLTISLASFCQEKQKSESTIKINDRPLEVSQLNSPLYILDNKEIAYNDISKIKPDQIQSITILKDSTAVAQYGERGNKGVIIIESKESEKLPAQKKVDH